MAKNGKRNRESERQIAYVFEGYTDAETFNARLEQCLVPQLKGGQIVVMDNYSIQKRLEYVKLSKERAVNCVIFLPIRLTLIPLNILGLKLNLSVSKN